jgi:hypothetical protein
VNDSRGSGGLVGRVVAHEDVQGTSDDLRDTVEDFARAEVLQRSRDGIFDSCWVFADTTMNVLVPVDHPAYWYGTCLSSVCLLLRADSSKLTGIVACIADPLVEDVCSLSCNGKESIQSVICFLSALLLLVHGRNNSGDALSHDDG